MLFILYIIKICIKLLYFTIIITINRKDNNFITRKENNEAIRCDKIKKKR